LSVSRGRRLALTLALAAAVIGGCARSTTTVRSSPAPPPAAPAKPASPAPTAMPPPVVAPQLSPPEEGRLRRDTTARIDSAERLVKQVGDRRLGADQQETLSTIQSFLAKARHAMAAQDLQQAFTLADKAEALAQELLRTTR
jgi:hypothetical protein